MRLRNFVLFFALLIASLVHAEGVESRIDLPGSPNRIPGVQTLLAAPGGLFTLGGSALRYLPKGKTKWVVLHRVPGDDLYRIAADDNGRLLASWEKEKRFHLFVPGTKKHLTFPKPPRVKGGPSLYSLDGFNFTKDGSSAIVIMAGTSGNSLRTTSAYRYRLDGKGEPVLLCQQTGLKLFTSDRVALFATPKYESARWDSRDGLPLGSLYAYEFTGDQTVKRTLLSGEKDNWSVVRMAGGNEDDGLAVIILNEKKERFLLRWRLGQEKGTLSPLPKLPLTGDEKIFLAKTGDLVEIWKTQEEGLQIERRSPGGGVKSISLPPLPWGDPDIEQDTAIYAVRERKNGDLLLHWGNYLVWLGEGKPKMLDVEPRLGRLDEWAGVAIYTTDPESLWLGVEVGAGRDFVRVGLDEVEKRAKLVK